MRWFFPPVDQAAITYLGRELSLPPLLARLLVLRGFRDSEAAHSFLHPSLSQLHDPRLMADMETAVRRLLQAIKRRERILIYGDYDVDGTMAVVVLSTALRTLGANVDTYIPHRIADGYGMRLPAIEKAAAEKCAVVLSVDTGIREHEVIGRARELGVDCIVTDHHLPDETLPPAFAILNPRRHDCPYPEKNLSGAGVAFKLAQALFAASASPLSDRHVGSYLKVVALGTIADVVPLTGENRVIARFGLDGLSKPVHKGLGALLEVAGLQGRAITAGDVGFRLAPRLNAAGRMESARDVIDLLTTPDAAQAGAIAERLDNLNRERQLAEEQILREIDERIAAEREAEEKGQGAPEQTADGLPGLLPDHRFFLVFAGKGWHRGVIGIAAQRLVDRYHRPTLVVSIEEPATGAPEAAEVQRAVGYGSGRSISGFHLLDALTSVRELFERFGGHAQAAGFSLLAARIPELAAALESYARRVLTREDLEPVVRLDAEVNLRDLDWNFSQALKQLEPFGLGNPTPVFAARGLRISSQPRVLKERHLKLRVSQGSKNLEAVGWGWADAASALNSNHDREGNDSCRAADLTEGREIDAAFTLDESVFQELTTLQLVMRDVRLSHTAKAANSRSNDEG